MCAASFTFDESNLIGEVITVGISNLNFGSDDSPNLVPITYPIVAGQNSYDKYIKNAFSGSFTRVNNLRIWRASGSYVTGEGCSFSGSVAYVQPTQTTNGDSAIPTSEPSDPNVGVGGDIYGNIDGPVDSGYSLKTDYCRFQMQTTVLTPGGSVNEKTFVLQYDEQ